MLAKQCVCVYSHGACLVVSYLIDTEWKLACYLSIAVHQAVKVRLSMRESLVPSPLAAVRMQAIYWMPEFDSKSDQALSEYACV